MWFASVKTYCAEHCGGVEVRLLGRFVYGPECCIGSWIPITSPRSNPPFFIFYLFYFVKRYDFTAITTENRVVSSSLLPKIICNQIIKRTMSQDSRSGPNVQPSFSDALPNSSVEGVKGEKSPRQDGICLHSILTESAEGTDFCVGIRTYVRSVTSFRHRCKFQDRIPHFPLAVFRSRELHYSSQDIFILQKSRVFQIF